MSLTSCPSCYPLSFTCRLAYFCLSLTCWIWFHASLSLISLATVLSLCLTCYSKDFISSLTFWSRIYICFSPTDRDFYSSHFLFGCLIYTTPYRCLLGFLILFYAQIPGFLSSISIYATSIFVESSVDLCPFTWCPESLFL